MTADASTIAALLTPLAPGAIAVIALAGPDVDAILERLLRRHGSDHPPKLPDRRPTFCRLVDRHEVVDDVVVVRVARGDVETAEINTHGGVRIVQRTLLLIEQCGAKTVDADVLLARCGRTGAVERDVDRTLLGVSSRRLTRWLLRQRRILPAYLEQRHTLGPSETAAFRHRSRAAIRLIQGLRVAVIGPPNAGKSTLANRLIGTDRVVTSERAGTTRDWVSETALIQGWPVTLTDTAGIRETDCDVEAEAIRRGRHQAGLADLVIIVLDATTPPDKQRDTLASVVKSLSQKVCGTGFQPAETQLTNLCHSSGIGSKAIPTHRPRITVLNKCDIAIGPTFSRDPKGSEISSSSSGSSQAPLHISALTGTGVDKLESHIASVLGLDQLDDDMPTAFLPRQLSEDPTPTGR